MRKQVVLAAAIVAAIVVCSGPAPASVRYDFTGSYSDRFSSFTGSFTYVVPTFITSNTVATPASLSNCGADIIGSATCHEVDFHPAAFSSSGNQLDFFGDRSGSIDGVRFGALDDTALATPRVRSDFNLLTDALAVTEHLPEPAAWTIVLLGLGAIGAIIRWRHEGIRRLR